jgi:NAD(P)-dependent dehydrogenase (short-subunit alcohol dehydrogenase family)
MSNAKLNTALIVGAGAGLSASLARALSKDGVKVALAARSIGDLDALVKETGAQTFACDASRQLEVDKLFADLDASLGAPDIVIYNASFRTRGAFVELDPADVEKAIAVTAYGAFLVAQQAARRMLPKKHGAILLTGASAGVKGYAQSAPGGITRGARQPARSRRHRRHLYASHPPAAQRLGLGDRGAPMGREVLVSHRTGKSKYLSGNGSFVSVKCHHSLL